MQNIHIKLQASKALFCVALLLHILAGVAVFMAQISLVFKLILCLVLLFSFVFFIRHHVLRQTKNSIQSFYYKNDAWWLNLKNGQTQEMDLLGNSFVTPLITILNFRASTKPSRRYSVLLPADSLSHDEARRLRVFLTLVARISVSAIRE